MLPSMLLLRMLCLLMLMFLLRDADGVCPFEPNPVNVQPAVAVEYGAQLHVNCTSDNEDYMDTIWKVGKEGVLTEDEKKLPSLNLSLTDWNMTVECIININDTHECSKGVDLTIYKTPEVVLSIINKQALGKETLYELQCDVLNVAPVQYLTLRWYTNDELSKTDSFSDTTRTPVNESRTLNLTVRREDDVVKVRCEAQLGLESHGHPLPAISKTVSAHHADRTCDTDDNPLTVEPAVIIAAYGEEVDVNCTSDYEDHEGIFWRVGNIDLEVEEDESFVSFSSSLTDWDMKAECVIKYIIHSDTRECSKDVEINVYKNPEVVLSIIDVQALGEETLYELQCDVLNVAPVQYLSLRWYTNDELSNTDSFSDTTRTPVNESRTLNLTVRREDDVVEVRCEAQLDFRQNKVLPTAVSQTYNVSAHYAPELKMKNDTEDVYVLEGTDISLNCEAEGNPPPVFDWTSDGLNVPVDTDILNITQVNTSSVYICTATNYLGNITKHFHIHGTNEKIEATSASTPIPKTAETEDNGALFRCHAELHLGPNGPEFPPNRTSEPYAADVYYKPIINRCALHHSVVEHNSSLDMLPCNADGNPPPTIKWYYKDKEVMNSSELLSRNDSGNYWAEFENRMGVNRVPVDITVEYGPSFTCNKSYDVEVNGKLQCEPEGIPTPRLTWFKDGKEIVPPQPWTTEDSGEYLIKASNNHGEASHMLYVNILYPPELTTGQLYATNEVGNVTRSVAQMMKGTPDFTYTVIWVPIIAGIIVMMIVAVVIYRNHKKKWGLYTFVSNVDHSMTTMRTSMS